MDRPTRRLEPIPPPLAVVLGVALLGLTVLVGAAGRSIATASGGPAPAGDVGAAVLRAVLILVFTAEAVVVLLVVWAFWPGQGRRRPGYRPGSWWWPLASFLQSAVALVAVWLLVHYHPFGRAGGGGLLSGLLGAVQPAFPNGTRQSTAGPSGYAWITVAVVAAVLLVLARLLVAGTLRRRRATPIELLAEQVEAAIGAGLAELEQESDPRAAVIGAYARMVDSLGAAGVARRPQETAREYLERTLAELGIERPPVSRLTDLFELAKFSHHAVDDRMKAAAAEALTAIRDELGVLLAPRAGDRDPVPA